MPPVGDTFLLLTVKGVPMTPRLSQLQSAERSPNGRVLASLMVEGQPPQKVELDVLWADWPGILGRAAKVVRAT